MLEKRQKQRPGRLLADSVRSADAALRLKEDSTTLLRVMDKNLKYYNNRDKDVQGCIDRIISLSETINQSTEIDMLMGIEGNIRNWYYEAFAVMINDFEMGNRSKMPSSNEVNAMISFINSMCYTLCLDMIYHTLAQSNYQLFLHQPGERRYSLALDIAEIFKPILADRLIFSLLNKKTNRSGDFDI